MKELSSIKVLVAHRLPLIQAGLSAALQGQLGIELRAESSALDRSGLPDDANCVAVLDFEQGLCFADAIGHLHGMGRWPCRVLIVAEQTSEWGVRQALKRGVLGFHRIDSSVDQIVSGVRAVAHGARSFDDAAMACMADSLLRPDLTQREQDVLRLLGEGACNKEIARRLGIASGTVKTHVRALLEKLGVQTRLQVIVVAKERGLVSRPDEPIGENRLLRRAPLSSGVLGSSRPMAAC